MYVGFSAGRREGAPKDTLANVSGREAFCVNVVSEELLEAMNKTSAEVGPDVDEFALAGLRPVGSELVDAPFVAECPAVFECASPRVVELPGSGNTLVIGRVVGVRLAPELVPEGEDLRVDYGALRAVGRLSGPEYLMPDRVADLPRPQLPSAQRSRIPSS